MHDLPTAPIQPAGSRLTHRLRLARAVLVWERLWPRLVPPLGLAGILVSLALLDVLPLLPAWLHAVVLAAFGVTIAGLLWHAVARLCWPGEGDAARRLERDSGLAHRPLAVLADHLATDAADPAARALWLAHQRRMAGLAERLRLTPPAPGMPARDPLGLRAMVILLLTIAFAIGGADAPSRLRRAVSPPLALPGAAIEVWITPPAYTGLAPILLHPGEGPAKPLDIPAGSTLTAALTGGWGNAELELGDDAVPFQRQSGNSQRLETRLTQGGQMTIRQFFRELATWQVRIHPDALPSIELLRPPEAGPRGRLRVAVEGSDDWGVAKAWLEIRRPGDNGPPLVAELPLPSAHPRSFRAESWHDLTAHPWAGLPVSLRPMAEDTAGQVAGGEPMTVTLPERAFANPVARALVEQRKLLTQDRGQAPEAAAVIDGVLGQPALFDGDATLALALAVAELDLRRDRFDLAEVQDLLWNAAVRIEDGAAGSARRDVEQARAALEKALAAGAPAAEIQRLLDAYRNAVRQMVQALAAQSGRVDQNAPPDARTIDARDLDAMLDAMAGLARSGSREALEHMLDQMSRIMEGLSAARPSANPAATRALSGLRDLARRQQQQLDRAFRESQKPNAPVIPGAARDQKGLQQQLEELAKELGRAGGKAPDSLPRAGAAMSQAAGALEQGAWGMATAAQQNALQRLQEAIGQAEQQMGGPGSAGAIARDPLGRSLSGPSVGDDDVRIPDHGEMQRSRQILDELRRREGDHQRPQPERDYIKRLLDTL